MGTLRLSKRAAFLALAGSAGALMQGLQFRPVSAEAEARLVISTCRKTSENRQWKTTSATVAAACSSGRSLGVRVLVGEHRRRVPRCLWNLSNGPTVAGGLIKGLRCDIVGG